MDKKLPPLPPTTKAVPLKSLKGSQNRQPGWCKKAPVQGFVTVPSLKATTSPGSDNDGQKLDSEVVPTEAVKDQLWYEVSGNPNGVPSVHVHGGPGWHSEVPDDRSFFDPGSYKIVLFDQRGCGGSKPKLDPSQRAASFQRYSDLTIDQMVEDMELVRRAALDSAGGKGKDKTGGKKKVEATPWVVVGVSWGSALALAYACRYPQHTAGLVLQGIYTGTVAEHSTLFSADTTSTTTTENSGEGGGNEAQERPDTASEVMARALHYFGVLEGEAKDEKDPDTGSLVQKMLTVDPVLLHDRVASRVRSVADTSPFTEDSLNRLMSLWENYENAVTYPEDGSLFAKEMRKIFAGISRSTEEGGSEATKEGDQTKKIFVPTRGDFSQTLFQLILFPKMMRLQPTLNSVDSLRSLGTKKGGGGGSSPTFPIFIIHGQGDAVCPVGAADSLFRNMVLAGVAPTTSGKNGGSGGRLTYWRLGAGTGHESQGGQVAHWMVTATEMIWDHLF